MEGIRKDICIGGKLLSSTLYSQTKMELVNPIEFKFTAKVIAEQLNELPNPNELEFNELIIKFGKSSKGGFGYNCYINVVSGYKYRVLSVDLNQKLDTILISIEKVWRAIDNLYKKGESLSARSRINTITNSVFAETSHLENILT